MPMLVTPMGQGLLPAGQQTTLVHDARPMRRTAVQHKMSMPDVFQACAIWGCCLQAGELAHDPLSGG